MNYNVHNIKCIYYKLAIITITIMFVQFFDLLA